MLKLRRYRSPDNPKIKWLIVEHGYSCTSSGNCPHGHECKYHATYKWHNFSVRVSRFFQRHFNIDFHFPVYFQKHRVDLSGTARCPHKVPRIYTCWDCAYSSGLRTCTNDERHRLIHEGRYAEILCDNKRRCALFKKIETLSYDEDTGEVRYE